MERLHFDGEVVVENGAFDVQESEMRGRLVMAGDSIDLNDVLLSEKATLLCR